MSDRIDSTVETLRLALGRASRQAEVRASNLANVDTPGYRALDVRFDEFLSAGRGLETSRTDSLHLAGSPPASRGTLVEAAITRMRHDGNTVDIDLEMTKLSRAAGRYRTATEMLRKRFGLLIYTATDGRGGA